MSSASTTRPSRSRRRAPDDGPRASLRQLLPFVFEQKGVLVVVAVLSVLAAVATLAQPLVVGQVIDRVQKQNPLGLLVWVLVGLVVASSVISGIQHFLLQRTGTAVVYSSRRRLIAQLLHLPVQEYDARRTGDLVSRVGTDTTLLYAVLTQGLADSIGNALIFVGAIVAMFIIDPVLLVLILVVVGASVAVVVALSGRIRRATAVQQEKVGELASGVERAVGSIRTIRASGASDRERESIEHTARGAYEAGVQVAKASAFVVPVAGVALQLSLLVVLGVGGFRVASGAITIAGLVTFVMFLFFLVQPLGSFFGAITSVGQALGALGRIQEVLDLRTETACDAEVAASVAVGTSPISRPPRTRTTRRRRRSSSATCISRTRMPWSRAPSLGDRGGGPARRGPRRRDGGGLGSGRRGAARRVVPRAARGARRPGRAVGCGQVHDPRADRAVLRPDGGLDPARRRRPPRHRPHAAARPARLCRAGCPDPRRHDRRQPAARVAVGIRRGVRARAARREPRRGAGALASGSRRTGGRGRRHAVGRRAAAARDRPRAAGRSPILLLDESTSSLDGLNEQRMREAIDAVAAGRTLVVIAHRLSTVVDSDLIVVLDRGEVVGQGTHSELVETVPLYRDLAKHQLLV
jgi:ATP-binding cassette subfamily B protein